MSPSPLSIALHEALRARSEVDTHMSADRAVPLPILMNYQDSLLKLQAALDTAVPALAQIIRAREADQFPRAYQGRPR